MEVSSFSATPRAYLSFSTDSSLLKRGKHPSWHPCLVPISWSRRNAQPLFDKTGSLVKNKICLKGTTSVVLAGVVAALKLIGGTLADHSFLFLGAGEAGTGIAELIALEMSKQTKTPSEETRKKIWLVDSKGLIVSSRKDSLQHFKKPWAHEHEPVNNLLDAVKAIKPTVLIGSSGVGRTFTREVIEAVASFNEIPLILALSNPTSQSECTAEEAYTWRKENFERIPPLLGTVKVFRNTSKLFKHTQSSPERTYNTA